MYLLAVKIKS